MERFVEWETSNPCEHGQTDVKNDDDDDDDVQST